MNPIVTLQRYRDLFYQSGSADFLTVLDAERSLYTAEDALVQSRIRMATSYIALYKALGGGWNGFGQKLNLEEDGGGR